MREQQDVARIDWNKYQLEVYEPKNWPQVVAKFRGTDLAMVCVAGIAIAFAVTSGSDSLAVPIVAIVFVTILGISALIQDRGGDGPSTARSAKDQIEPGHARGDQAAT